ncbi:nickel ABC transporter substrate-binding protein [Staphylococcus marylandisciuri]
MKKLLVIVASCLLILAGCGSASKQDSKRTLSVELPLKTTSLAPYDTDVPVKIGAVESLFKATPQSTVKKELVESYSQPSAKELKLKLKKNIHFQNGKKLTGQAVKDSLEQSLKQSDLVKGSLPINHIKAHGQYVDITTKRPYPELKSELASPFAGIYDTHAASNVKNTPVGTGPYQIKQYNQSQSIHADRFKDYWKGKPKMAHVNVTYQEDGDTRTRDLKSSKADVISDVPVENVESLKNDARTKVSTVSGFRTSLLLYNHTSTKMTKPVREALDKVINRNSIAHHVYQGYATEATGPFNTNLDFIPARQPTQQDINKAKALLSHEGYSAKHPLKLNVATYNGRPELPKIAQVLQSDAKKANIDLDIRNVDDIEGYLKNKNQWDASMYSFGTIPRGDTGYFFNQAYMPHGAINKGSYHNGKIERLIQQLNTTVDVKARHHISNQIVQATNRDYANSYIAYNDNLVGMNDKVEHLKATPEDIYLIDYKVDKKS